MIEYNMDKENSKPVKNNANQEFVFKVGLLELRINNYPPWVVLILSLMVMLFCVLQSVID